MKSLFGPIHRLASMSFCRREVEWRDRGPIVSFSFDDFPQTAYTNGASILRFFGVHGTYYASVGLMGSSNSLGPQFTQREVEALLSDGHELASHTLGHVPCRGISPDQFRRQVQQGNEAIRQLIGRSAPLNFAYPFGQVTVPAKKMLERETVSCRGTYGGLNGPIVDLNLLRANSLYGDVRCFQAVERLIDRNERSKGWLIFYTHDVSDQHSPYGCTPDLLRATVSRSLKGGAHVATVAEVVTELSGLTNATTVPSEKSSRRETVSLGRTM